LKLKNIDFASEIFQNSVLLIKREKKFNLSQRGGIFSLSGQKFFCQSGRIILTRVGNTARGWLGVMT
jgi:hypothetical protein